MDRSGAKWSGGDIDPTLKAVSSESKHVWVRRLTVPEYIATVKASVNVDIGKAAKDLLPEELHADGFRNTAYNLNVDLKHVQAYASLAKQIVARVEPGKLAGRFNVDAKLERENMVALIEAMGRWVFRGPLEEHEFESFVKISDIVETNGGNFDEAVRFILEAMLQSPRFIYQVENQRSDGSRYPVGDYELASRMSYAIWGAPPGEKLLEAAERGVLYDNQILAEQVERMLRDPRAVDQSVEFLNQWLNLEGLADLQPSKKRFPNWDDRIANDMRLETEAFFKDIIWKQKRPMSDLLNAQVTFATPALAKHYGLETKVSFAAEDASGARNLQRFDLTTNSVRGGLLTQGSVLTIGGDQASMVTRGLFVLHELLRGVVKDPPPCVDSTPVPSKVGLSQRMISEQRIANKSCGGCHSKFEPLAFGLERFDGLGAYHEKDDFGNQLREDGQLLIPGTAKSVQFASSAELMDLLAKSDRVRQSLYRKVVQFVIGRPLTSSDHSDLEQIFAAADRGGSTYQSLISAIVLSDLVQLTRTEATLGKRIP